MVLLVLVFGAALVGVAIGVDLGGDGNFGALVLLVLVSLVMLLLVLLLVRILALMVMLVLALLLLLVLLLRVVFCDSKTATRQDSNKRWYDKIEKHQKSNEATRQDSKTAGLHDNETATQQPNNPPTN